MNPEAKVSAAFGPYYSDLGPDEKRDAIVIYRPPEPRGAPVRGRLRELKARLDAIRRRATAQRAVQKQVFAGYQKATGLKAEDGGLVAAPIGKNVLPVGRM
ncbi:MAG: peptidase S8 and S53 subtilisin kexin sedolisin, partial [Acidobacteriota bacterium]